MLDLFRRRSAKRRRVPRILLWGLAAIVGTALCVGLTRTGLDILVLLIIGVGVVLLERTVGDWLGELVGAGLSTIVLGTVLVIIGWLCFAPGGIAERFFANAAQRGYGTAYYRGFTLPPPSGVAGSLVPPGGATAATSGTPGARPARRIGSIGGAGGAGSRQTREEERPAHAAPQASGSDVDASRTPGRRLVSVTRLELRQLVQTNEQISLRVRVTARGEPASDADVEFFLGSRSLGVRRTDDGGTASMSFASRVPGQFRIRAEVRESDRYRTSSASATIQVLP